MDSIKTMRLIAAATTLSMAVACSQPTKVVESSTYKPTTQRFNIIEYVVQPGDSLTKISRKLTGTIEHWEKIAIFNGISDPLNLGVGEPLLVPAYLVTRNKSNYTVSSMTLHLGSTLPVTGKPATTPYLTIPSATVNTRTLDGSKQQSASKEVLTDSTPTSYPQVLKRAAVFQAEALPGSKQVTVNTKQVNVNRKFDVAQVEAATNNPGTGKTIRVIGTYYPKGIYSEPELASSLLMRVSPGSTFQYVETIGEWVKISTDTGIGYIRKSDAQIVGAKKTSTTIATKTL